MKDGEIKGWVAAVVFLAAFYNLVFWAGFNLWPACG